MKSLLKKWQLEIINISKSDAGGLRKLFFQNVK